MPSSTGRPGPTCRAASGPARRPARDETRFGLVRASPLDRADLRARVDKALSAFLSRQRRRFATLHQDSGWLGEPAGFGTATAILLGDLCLVWSDELLHGSGLDPATLARGRRVFDDMRTEVTVGQYLDMHTQVTGDTSTQRASLVARFKSAKYTVERPLLLGAAFADAPPEVCR